MLLLSTLLGSILIIGLDQLTKWWAVTDLQAMDSIQVIPGVLNFSYVENRGAAFGILQNRQILLLVLTTAVMLALLFCIWKKWITHPIGLVAVCLIVAGGLGNNIDRLFRSYVVDFIDIRPLFSFPVFNVADCAITVGVVLFAIYLLFWEEKEPNRRQKPDQKEKNNDTAL